ncbi:HD domain-containing protein [Candidatus Poriferisocius sp.]|uniref:HD domain-containing protein n=1 Tax=Candidatus Poriferisocius sp. TaxID=3101276 RepID=UPI003B02682C
MGGLSGRSSPGGAQPVITGAHLVRRFFQSIVDRGPDPAEEAWLLGLLTGAEAELYRQMSAADRSHALRSARCPALADDAQRMAAALHDVGKIQAGLGTRARVGATLMGKVYPRGLRGRWADYQDHPRLGAAMLREAGSTKLTVVWAAEHHLPLAKSSLLPEVAAALAAAD